jgi:hypothetical protein
MIPTTEDVTRRYESVKEQTDIYKQTRPRKIQGGSNMTGTDFFL